MLFRGAPSSKFSVHQCNRNLAPLHYIPGSAANSLEGFLGTRHRGETIEISTQTLNENEHEKMSPAFFFAKTTQVKHGEMVHPGRITWNLQITHLERKMIFQTSMIMFHVDLQGVYRDLYNIYTNGHKLFIGLYIWVDQNFRHQACFTTRSSFRSKKSHFGSCLPQSQTTHKKYKYKYSNTVHLYVIFIFTSL